MNINRATTLAVLFLVATSSLPLAQSLGQEFPATKVTKQHKWLQKFEGSWKTTSTAQVAPDAPASMMTGSIESKMFGDFWMINEMTTKFEEFDVVGRQTIGYDSAKDKYVGTWIDNSSDFMWEYEGSVDETGKILSLEAEGPDMSKPETMAQYRDMYEFISDDEIKFTSSFKGRDNEWIDFMTGTAKRTK